MDGVQWGTVPRLICLRYGSIASIDRDGQKQADFSSGVYPNQFVEVTMPVYNVFYTDKPLPAGTVPDFKYTLPLNFVTKEEALSNAFKLIYGGAIVWKIEGPNGFYLDREGVESEYRIFKST